MIIAQMGLFSIVLNSKVVSVKYHIILKRLQQDSVWCS